MYFVVVLFHFSCCDFLLRFLGDYLPGVVEVRMCVCVCLYSCVQIYIPYIKIVLFFFFIFLLLRTSL